MSVVSTAPRSSSAWRKLFRRLHHDEGGAVSVENMLILAAIALPILIFIIKVGWPRIKDFFNQGMTDLEGGANQGAAQ